MKIPPYFCILNYTIMNILELIKKELVGKPIRICVYKKAITSPVLVPKKKQGTTDRQWEENPTKFTTYTSRTRHLGFHSIFENTTIVDVISGTDECYVLTAITECGKKVFLPLDETIENFNGTLMLI